MGTRGNAADHEELSMGAYQYCTRKECEERQELKQIHEMEATLETCSLPQAQRKLDPCLAVSKFKRSAAGATHTIKPAEVLNRTLSHLQVICATRQATPEHPPVDNLQNWSEFLVDRLRAIQADATRLSSTDVGVSRNWHVQLVRILIWVRYWTYSLDDMAWLQRTINTMIGTAMESYWGEGERLEGLSDAEEKQHERMDDEMLCWSALLQVSKQQEHQAGSPMGQTDDSGCNNGWNLDRARDVGLPVEQKDDGEIALVCKKLPLEDDFPLTKAGSRVRDHWFAFGECYDGNEHMRISSAHIDRMLKAGMP
ncbi:MAG: hypothetical protein SGBAC_002040 [Bacillariaceae sp.]